MNHSIPVMVIEDLFSIPAGVSNTITEEIFFPKTKYEPKAECQRHIRLQKGRINDLLAQCEVNGDGPYYWRLLERERHEREKDIRKFKSIEFGLRNEIDRLRRRRESTPIVIK
jgi:hypothetical protein